jgi:DNA-binding MarR family transcriptional regulator
LVVTPESSPTYLFGDLLALARQSWVRAMADRLGQRGFTDYRRSDAAALRILRRRALSVGQLGEVMGMTRQAARKMAAGLQQRGFADLVRDQRDSRRLNVVLTDAGEAYARHLSEVIEALNRELAERVDLEQLVAADAVLRCAMGNHDRSRAALLVAPPRVVDQAETPSRG